MENAFANPVGGNAKKKKANRRSDWFLNSHYVISTVSDKSSEVYVKCPPMLRSSEYPNPEVSEGSTEELEFSIFSSTLMVIIHLDSLVGVVLNMRAATPHSSSGALHTVA